MLALHVVDDEFNPEERHVLEHLTLRIPHRRFVVRPGSGLREIAPFLLKKDAEAHAAKIGGKVVNFNDALKSAMSGG